ncbi:interleukin 17a/f1 [Kryptolebias marmoratus]|uniref:interleukin 17a/f1 n=1 Tax=Kryptolebias marmoratus TaxID=37003 RepID=UPI000D530427|nr:interleukin 17a/f1 [Kryptolebias marmoratus]
MFQASNPSKVTVVSAVLLMMMITQAAAKPHRKSSEGFVEETVPLRLDPSNLLPSIKMSSLANVSISPWTYNISRDDSMFPNVLSQAHCSLSGCVGSDKQEDRDLQSRPIMHQVLVLRRVKTEEEGHSYHYRLESKLISVGCTCVRPKVTIQQ